MSIFSELAFTFEKSNTLFVLQICVGPQATDWSKLVLIQIAGTTLIVFLPAGFIFFTVTCNPASCSCLITGPAALALSSSNSKTIVFCDGIFGAATVGG